MAADSFAARPDGVAGSRVARPPAQDAFPPDFATASPKLHQVVDRTGRLGVFAAGPAASRSSLALTASLLVAGLCGLAAAIAWLSASPAPRPEARAPIAIPQTPVAAAPTPSAPAPAADPVTTSSIPAAKAAPAKAAPAKAGFTAPLPRPARIERAGSILMIRPATD
ncbi:hypothetical protein [Hoeflea sp. BAL378]|uniref:hypothetical protein n=1 Tax=Hoeflea sp. BAL378 TaxID=1547437 RepID=UPI00126A6B4C|nr:hypothetical protein [Hoeflea sp. BAL378]